MIKAFGCSFLLLLLAGLAVWVDLTALIASKGFFYIALFLMLATVIAAFIILGKPIKTGTKDDEHKGE